MKTTKSQNITVEPRFKKHIERYLQAINVKKAVLETVQRINDEIHRNTIITQHLVYDGSTIGKMFDVFMPGYLTKHNNSSLHFKHGNDRIDPDNVCVEDTYYNSETKTSSSSARPVGAKTHNGTANKPLKYTHDKYGFYIFIRYNIEKDEEQNDPINIIVTHIYVGQLKHSDWKPSKSSSSGSSNISAGILNRQFIKIYDLKNEESCKRTKALTAAA